MSTAHIEAKKDQIAEVVFMPGDPLRAEKYAKKYLKEGYEKVSAVRNMYAFTGYTKDQNIRVTFMGHGMGMASSGIYAYELFKFYDVKRIVRLGTAALHNKNIKIFDIVVGKELVSDSNFGSQYNVEKNEILHVKPNLLDLIKTHEKEIETKIHYGRIISSDWFYLDQGRNNDLKWQEQAQKYGTDAKEMEAYGLEAIARYLNKEALTIVTCVHDIFTAETTDSKYREEKVNEMADLAIKALQKFEENN